MDKVKLYRNTLNDTIKILSRKKIFKNNLISPKHNMKYFYPFLNTKEKEEIFNDNFLDYFSTSSNISNNLLKDNLDYFIKEKKIDFIVKSIIMDDDTINTLLSKDEIKGVYIVKILREQTITEEIYFKNKTKIDSECGIKFIFSYVIFSENYINTIWDDCTVLEQKLLVNTSKLSLSFLEDKKIIENKNKDIKTDIIVTSNYISDIKENKFFSNEVYEIIFNDLDDRNKLDLLIDKKFSQKFIEDNFEELIEINYTVLLPLISENFILNNFKILSILHLIYFMENKKLSSKFTSTIFNKIFKENKKYLKTDEVLKTLLCSNITLEQTNEIISNIDKKYLSKHEKKIIYKNKFYYKYMKFDKLDNMTKKKYIKRQNLDSDFIIKNYSSFTYDEKYLICKYQKNIPKNFILKDKKNIFLTKNILNILGNFKITSLNEFSDIKNDENNTEELIKIIKYFTNSKYNKTLKDKLKNKKTRNLKLKEITNINKLNQSDNDDLVVF